MAELGRVGLHKEHLVTIKELHAWGVLAKTDRGVEVSIDRVKMDGRTAAVGTELLVVILDESRLPARASAERRDLEIAARFRRSRSEDESN